MGGRSAISIIGSRVADAPGIRQWRERNYEHRFLSHTSLTHNLYRGVFPGFAEARASMPPVVSQGYDNQPSAELYRERTHRIFINDYPAMFWLARLFEAGNASVFDIGGHIGIAYYAYQRYLHYPEALRWCVQDVPAVNTAGTSWAEVHDASRRLSFTDRPDDADGTDILFAAGSLQYLDYTLTELLARLQRPPPHLLLNSVPIHPTASYFTVQNMGTACCPYRITAEREFVDGLKAQGYALRDRWENHDRSCTIPFHPERSLDRYFGFLFSRGT